MNYAKQIKQERKWYEEGLEIAKIKEYSPASWKLFAMSYVASKKNNIGENQMNLKELEKEWKKKQPQEAKGLPQNKPKRTRIINPFRSPQN